MIILKQKIIESYIMVKMLHDYVRYNVWANERIINYLAEQKDGILDSGMKYHQLRSEMIHHCMNHSTYHRGQIITMGKQLNLSKAPSTDLIFYYRLTKVNKKTT
jgi:uncharacterized damage-inducible protein DinB